MSSEQFSMRIPKDTKEKLEELAKATGRSKAFIAIEAIDKYLELEAWQISAIKEGVKAVDENKTVSIKEVKKTWGIN
ncbi:MAG: ribbon-helix-helix domain-containing protein [Candidatus Gastranaerophilales bacterium]|nr:ribbon-helix-helix domain-containing protein [Candidatus Gastranaerophilales bacterium]